MLWLGGSWIFSDKYPKWDTLLHLLIFRPWAISRIQELDLGRSFDFQKYTTGWRILGFAVVQANLHPAARVGIFILPCRRRAIRPEQLFRNPNPLGQRNHDLPYKLNNLPHIH